ncbi:MULTISPECIES: hypothetical protein [Actinokineospora]|uniref:Secreted protein n=1 Tax=Actinokineospora fastidiosa TaxID=1816 RepID=A0A918GII5_9PSEU|nr:MULTISPECIES: hypothetical protein [Actinokineospora]UVS81017.1 hypothetical protein Actkin_04769 [Actinokineospora sp. UTMC 2448]GGS38974.1 hypothetical protein GCM10010171_37400 [Actinokineospora fastidiosa]
MLIRKAAAVLAAGAAAFAMSAGTANADDTAYLYVGPLSHCEDTGDRGVAGGVFSSYTCQLGIAGYSVLVTAAPGTVSGVYLNTFGSAFNTVETCDQTGANGVAAGVFTSYHCQLGIAGYSLTVSG